MIQYKYKLSWKGKLAIVKYHKAVTRAVTKSAIKVQRKAKQLLNSSGKGVTAKLGLNTVKGKGVDKLSGAEKTELRFRQGLAAIKGLSTVHGKKSRYIGGGSFGGENRIYWYGEPLHRWVQSSEPGTAPHKQTGTLQRSVSFQLMRGGLMAKVGPAYRLKYARLLELGGRGLVEIAARPYMQPAFEEVKPEIDEIFKTELGKVVI